MSLKISIITPSYNQGRFIKDTIESVLHQNYSNFEHIIIDGGSTDDTVEILKQYPHLKWISEKDSGPIEAINKGIKMSTGDVITWLNSDDYFAENIFNDVMSAFEDTNVKVVCGFINFIDLDKKILWVNDNDETYNVDHLVRNNSDIIRQPSSFYYKSLFYDVGGLDDSLKLIFDYDLLVKMYKLSAPVIIRKVFAYQRIYDSTLTRSSLRKQAIEIFKVSRRHGATYKDRINRLILKRFLFPSVWTGKKSLPVKVIKFFYKDFY
jgi:glycosyltransferase involved in cell wall biosynthesis